MSGRKKKLSEKITTKKNKSSEKMRWDPTAYKRMLKSYHLEFPEDPLFSSITFTVTSPLESHNEKRLKLGLSELKELPDDDEVKRVDEEYTLWLYRVGGDKYNDSKEAIN